LPQEHRLHNNDVKGLRISTLPMYICLIMCIHERSHLVKAVPSALARFTALIAGDRTYPMSGALINLALVSIKFWFKI